MKARQEAVWDFWQREFSLGTIKGVAGVSLRYACRATAGQTALVVVTGRSEFIEKYAEIFYDLRELGISFFIYDHRGQGGSGRLLADPQKGHVDSFASYVKDLELFMARIVRPAQPRKIILLSHSMGGTISLLYAGEYQKQLAGLILSSPMLSINTQPFPGPVARGIARLAAQTGRGTEYVIGAGPWNRLLPFEGNVLTGSRERFALNLQLVEKNPILALGGPTFGWLDQSFRMLAEVRRKRQTLNLPVLLLLGEEDKVVGLPEQLEVCQRLVNCRKVVFPEGRHELLMEEDRVRAEVLDEIRTFIARISQ